jgi:hypothetical protein
MVLLMGNISIFINPVSGVNALEHSSPISWFWAGTYGSQVRNGDRQRDKDQKKARRGLYTILKRLLDEWP